MRHSGHKPYKCPHCTYACIQAISLKVHVKNKHPGMGGVYSCELCLYRSVNKQQYENHVLDHKNGLIQLEQTPEGSKMQKSANNARRIKGNAEHRAQTQPKFQTVSFQSDLLQAQRPNLSSYKVCPIFRSHRLYRSPCLLSIT